MDHEYAVGDLKVKQYIIYLKKKFSLKTNYQGFSQYEE